MKITFNDWDEGAEEVSHCPIENKINEMSISYDHGHMKFV